MNGVLNFQYKGSKTYPSLLSNLMIVIKSKHANQRYMDIGIKGLSQNANNRIGYIKILIEINVMRVGQIVKIKSLPSFDGMRSRMTKENRTCSNFTVNVTVAVAVTAAAAM